MGVTWNNSTLSPIKYTIHKVQYKITFEPNSNPKADTTLTFNENWSLGHTCLTMIRRTLYVSTSLFTFPLVILSAPPVWQYALKTAVLAAGIKSVLLLTLNGDLAWE